MSPQQTIAHYRVTAKLGEGGMGEVWRATDTKLGREVALKILPASFAQDAERMARFEREAKILASLNHPHVAQIYGIEERTLVMELVEGETLRGPLPLATALEYARQIADALEAAHEKGIVHRDLKPRNIMVTPAAVVKVLDFELARVAEGADDSTNSPTQTISPTRAGVILGTAGYMSPEQARGKTVDKRADIWAFGCVLYEMLTGQPAFSGDTTTDILAEVVTKQPDLALVPAPVRRLLCMCLAKDPKKRLRDIGDWKLLVEESAPAASFGPSSSRFRNAAWAVAAGAFALIAAAVAYRHSREEPPRLVTFSLSPPEKGEFATAAANSPFMAVSPDGRRIVFTTLAEGKMALWERDLDASTPRMLAGTENGIRPFWAPNSRSLGFFAGGQLKRIDVTGGPALSLADASNPRGGSWNQDDVILFTPNQNSGVLRVSAAGGSVAPVTVLDKARNETQHTEPWFLPDGRHFLYAARSQNLEKGGIYVGDLASKERKLATAAVASNAVYAPPGYLLFVRDQTLMAQPFDETKLATTGDALPVAETVGSFIGPGGVFAYFSASQNGVLAYLSRTVDANSQLTWFDRTGRSVGAVGTPGYLQWASLSPDGKTVAMDPLDVQSGNRDLWLHDLARGTSSRLTHSGSNDYPVWSPDGTRIAFLANREGNTFLSIRAANGTGQEEKLEAVRGRPDDWSRDGRYLIVERADGKTLSDIWVHPQFGDKKPFAYLQSEFRETQAKLSPDGRWLAYRSDESKGSEIFMVSFPMPGAKWRISTSGGKIPVWSRDGRELYYVSTDNKMMAVEIKTTGGRFEPGVPKPLFDVRLGGNNPNFDVSKDGRFLIPAAGEQSARAAMTVVLNWPAGLRK